MDDMRVLIIKFMCYVRISKFMSYDSVNEVLLCSTAKKKEKKNNAVKAREERVFKNIVKILIEMCYILGWAIDL